MYLIDYYRFLPSFIFELLNFNASFTYVLKKDNPKSYNLCQG
jgi:hypothetical protein